MGTKISEMQATGSAPSGSHLAIADNSQNYKLPSQSFAKTFLDIEQETGTSRTLSDGDSQKVIVCSNNSSTTLTVPSGLTDGFNCVVAQEGSGVVSILPSSGATVQSFGDINATAGQYACLKIIPISTDQYAIKGAGQKAFSNQYSANFDGTDDTLNCTIPATLMTADFTTSIWVRFPATPSDVADSAIWENNYNAADKIGWRLYFDSTSASNHGIISMWVSNGTGLYDNPFYTSAGDTNLGDNTWSHIAWGRNSGTHFLYINGSQPTIAAGTQGFDSSSSNFSDSPALKINATGIGSGPFQGQCDEAAIWDSALTSAQITNIYKGETNGGSGGTSGKAGDLSTFSPEIWWRMGDGAGDAPASGGTIGTIYNQGSLASSNSATGVNGPTFSTDIPS